MDNIAETARTALEVLSRDGWCKGATTWIPVGAGRSQDPRSGSHCLGGAWNLALYGVPVFDVTTVKEDYQPLEQVILGQYPEIEELGFTDPVTVIVNFNDRFDVTETDVRAILEKLAAKEEM